MKQIPFKKMISGKVIIAFLIACTALFLAWSVSKVAFREMLGTVERVSEPNEKLSVVNKLYRRITLLEQMQRSLPPAPSKQTFNTFSKESRLLRKSLDTLEILYKGDETQTTRISTMKSLLQKREKLFADYLSVREAIVSNQVLTGEVGNLTEILLNDSRLPDSITVQKAENRFSTTTIIPAEKEETPVGLLRRIFGKRKTETLNKTPEKIINEELSITFDTITSPKKDSLYKAVDSVLVNLQKKQQSQTEQFIAREKQLSDAGHILISQMLSILEQVEKEVVRQASANQRHAALLVSSSSKQIKLIIAAFFSLTALLVYFILADISRNNKYRQMLEQANREANYHSMAKQRFLSNMSHEIRTPLQAIMGYSELARQQEMPEKQNINAIYNSSAHLLQIVNEVLDYNNIISGKFSFSNSVFSPAKLLDEVVSVMKIQAENKGLQLLHNYADTKNLALEGDPFRLKQMLYNLLGNAIKFTNSGFVSLAVTAKVSEDHAYLNIIVEDTGIGMSEEDTHHIFEEFDRGESVKKNIHPGSGLGLSIVKALTDAQHGRIYVKSRPGKGSRFTVFLPFPVGEAQGEDSFREFVPVQKHYSGKVWMVDDDLSILQLCSAIFKKNGIACQCFSDAESVLAQDPDDQLSCVLLDMRMPGMGGPELCHLLRKKLPQGMYIFALTAQALPWEQEDIMKQGFDGLLMKPFREQELLDLIYSTEDNVPGIRENDPFPDLQNIREMAFGDQDSIFAILRQFIRDSMDDSLELEIKMNKNKTGECLLLLHRIAGRTAQFGAPELAAGFRKAEQTLREEGGFTPQLKNEINELLTRLKKLSALISDKAKAGERLNISQPD